MIIKASDVQHLQDTMVKLTQAYKEADNEEAKAAADAALERFAQTYTGPGCGLSWDEEAGVLSIAKGFEINAEGFVVKAPEVGPGVNLH